MSASFRRALAALRCTPAEAGALGVLAVGAVAALVLLWVLARSAPSSLQAQPVASGLMVTAEDVVVHVSGHVHNPGLYRLAAGSRVADALHAAGGALPDAVLTTVNLARPLADGEQLLVPGPPPPTAGQATGPAAPDAPAGAHPRAKLNLNTATAAQLEALAGIGPVLAARIVSHREEFGPYTSVGQLRDVPGIGEKLFQLLAPQVTT